MTCLACGFAHSSLDRCEVAARKRVANEAPQVANPVANHAQPVANEKPRSRHGKYADLRKRREYMRQFMAARRFAAKRAKGASQ